MRQLGIFLPTETVEAAEKNQGGELFGVTPKRSDAKPVVWHTARVVGVNEDGTYCVRYDESGEYWPVCPPGDIRRDLRLPTAVEEIIDDDETPKEPETWQYKMLMLQESIPATFLICVIVLIELVVVSDMEDKTAKVACSLLITAFFFFELVSRLYYYKHTYAEFCGFFSDPFRIIDTLLVLIDIVLLLVEYTLGGVQDGRAIKFIRVIRLLRNAKGLKSIKSARSFKFVGALYACKLPTDARKMLAVLDSLAWTVFIVAVVVVQFVVMNLGLLQNKGLTSLSVVLVGFFFVEVAMRLGAYCKVKDDPLAFFYSPVNCIDTLAVAVDLALVALAVLEEANAGASSSNIKVIRLVRIARFARFAHLVKVFRSDKSTRDLIDASCCANLCPASEEEVQEQKESQTKNVCIIGNEPPSTDVVSFSGYRGVKYADGCVFQGDWVTGLEEGAGQIIFPNGDKYRGNFKQGKKHGRGLFLFKSGGQFRGSFLRNNKNGFGTYTWKDGDRFEATFENGKENGKATFFSTDGRVVNYHFSNGVEVPPPEDEDEQATAAKNFKGLDFKSILAPGVGEATL
mmetsp:Transcript_63478/g.119181  ORF Transcript_63478/g.119181 Transcript_63478/m.119181 type:complete len:571 (+) Transcript_63478:732-2444(+)